MSALASPPMLHTAEFDRTFSAAHRVWNDPGKCSRIHGHNYRVHVIVTTVGLDEQGFTVPLDAVKEIVDALDHRLILARDDAIEIAADFGVEDWIVRVPGVPSTEFLAQWIADEIMGAIAEERRRSVLVHLRETDSISATGSASIA